MRQYLCSVALADNPHHIVANKVVTVPEIAILKRIHGDGAITNIRPPADKDLQTIVRSDAEERERLTLLYDNAHPGENEPIASRLFGPMSVLPTSLRQIGIDPAAAADEMRRRAAEMAQAADALADESPLAEADGESFFDELETSPTAADKKAA